MGKLQSIVRAGDCRMIRSLYSRTIMGESGCSRAADLPISRTAGLLPYMAYPPKKRIPLWGTRRTTFGFQGIGGSCTCGRGALSNISPGQLWDAANKLRLYSPTKAEFGFHSG